jgi:ATP adenylyltransferase
MLRSVNLHREDDTSGKQAGAYNLLATRQWMLLVPRSQESVESIQVNSLGFAGALLVRNEQQMQTLKALSPFTLLSRVGIPLNADC